MGTTTKNTNTILPALKKQIEWEIEKRGINPAEQKFIEDSILEIFATAEAKEKLLLDRGIFSLPAWNDTKNLLDRKADFKSYFSEFYEKQNLAQSQQALPARSVNIRRMQPGKDANYQTVFDSFGRPLDDMVVSENTICQILFSEDEESKAIRAELDLKSTWAHFLIKVGKKFFVVRACLDSDGLGLGVRGLGDSPVWGGEGEFRFVVSAEKKL